MKLSICIVVKDRSKVPYKEGYLYLLPNCIKSISKYHSPEDIEIVICDFYSKDWPIEDWIDEYRGEVSVKIIKENGDFSLGKGRNLAAKEAKNSAILFLDADCLIDHRAIDAGLYYVRNGITCFPFISFTNEEGEIKQGHNLNNGAGVCFIVKDVFFSTPGWPEFKSWGGEDDVFYNLIKKRDKKRYNEKGIIHQWHPSEISQIHYKNRLLSDYKQYIKQGNSEASKIVPDYKKVVDDIRREYESILENDKPRKKESIIVVSKFLKNKISNIEDFKNVVRCDLYPTSNYLQKVGEEITHTFKSSTFRPEKEIEVLDDKRISKIDEYKMPITIYGYLRSLPSINYSRTVTSEFVITNWLLLFYEKVHLAGHFTDYNDEREVRTYYGATYKANRLEIKNELKFLQNLENKIILL